MLKKCPFSRNLDKEPYENHGQLPPLRHLLTEFSNCQLKSADEGLDTQQDRFLPTPTLQNQITGGTAHHLCHALVLRANYRFFHFEGGDYAGLSPGAHLKILPTTSYITHSHQKLERTEMPLSM